MGEENKYGSHNLFRHVKAGSIQYYPHPQELSRILILLFSLPFEWYYQKDRITEFSTTLYSVDFTISETFFFLHCNLHSTFFFYICFRRVTKNSKMVTNESPVLPILKKALNRRRGIRYFCVFINKCHSSCSFPTH